MDVIFNCIDVNDIYVVVMGMMGRCGMDWIFFGSVVEKMVWLVLVFVFMIGGVE